MAPDRLTELRLTSFKSYRDVVLPLAPLTVLIGRNGGGKSNALDALDVLSRLARGGKVVRPGFVRATDDRIGAARNRLRNAG